MLPVFSTLSFPAFSVIWVRLALFCIAFCSLTGKHLSALCEKINFLSLTADLKGKSPKIELIETQRMRSKVNCVCTVGCLLPLVTANTTAFAFRNRNQTINDRKFCPPSGTRKTNKCRLAGLKRFFSAIDAAPDLLS